MKYALIWVVMTITGQGPTGGEIKDPSAFASEADCKSFGDSHKSRMEDWVRGRIQAHWDHPGGVDYICQPDGRPA